MKKIFLSLVLSAIVLTTYSQDSIIKTKKYRNEFGIDGTAFIKQFFNFNPSSFSNSYTPTYYITYRRHFKSGNLRFAIGGDIASQDIPSPYALDINKYHSNSYSIDARVGYEFFNTLSKRWQVFYGLDFRPTYAYDKNDAPFWNGGYANGRESTNQIYGLAPLLGFHLKLTDRLSLSTEASFSINIENSAERRYFIPETSAYPQIPDVEMPIAKKLYSSFLQPVFVIIAFDI